ncbi:MAG: hypothetical protein KZQ92_00430 [Candidatus Thiodiazotropha sp. (ex Lucinoma borealis)]|nr:hypothetical protein [Candidatus Thiodiazotropha sp. (ex Lucinoma borealis)]
MQIDPTPELLDANTRRDEIQATYDGFTQRIDVYEARLNQLSSEDIPAAERSYQDALKREVLNETQANRTASKKAKKDWDALHTEYRETQDVLDVIRQTREVTAEELRQAIYKSRRVLEKVLREGAPFYQNEALDQIESVLMQYITAYRLTRKDSTDGFQGPIERLINTRGSYFKDSIQLAADIRRGLAQAVNAPSNNRGT